MRGKRGQSWPRCLVRKEFALHLSCSILQSSRLVVGMMFAATIQLLCLCFGTELGIRLQSRSVVGDQVAEGASEVALESDCFFVVCCHREERFGVVRCMWRNAFAFGSLGLSDHQN